MMKRWLIGLLVFLAAGILLLPQLAADMHWFFSRQMSQLTLDPLAGWQLIIQGGKPLRFYWILLAIVALLLFWVLFSSSYLQYRSNMQVITPDIVTPYGAGQGQFGTARWMAAAEIGSYFAVWKVRKRYNCFRDLMAAGKASREEIKNADIRIG